MRKVKLFKFEKNEKTGEYETLPDGVGLFIQYGINFIELDEGIGNYTSVIVEKADGTIWNMHTDFVLFDD